MTSSTQKLRAAFLLAAIGLFLPAAGAAQEIMPEPGSAHASAAAALQPEAGSVGLFASSDSMAETIDRSESLAAPTSLVQTTTRGSVPLMAAGGTLLLAGALVGGDAGTILMVGGAGVLAWGVYLHF